MSQQLVPVMFFGLVVLSASPILFLAVASARAARKSKRAGHDQFVGQLATGLAYYFGTIPGTAKSYAKDPVELGRWVLGVLRNAPGKEADFLKGIAEAAMAQNELPACPELGTSRHRQIGSAIGAVCAKVSAS